MTFSFAVALTVVLFFGMLGCLQLGHRLGRRQAQTSEGSRAGLAAIEGAIFALFGLMLAFTFSGAATRFDTRRDLILEEANSVGTAWLRIEVLPADAQPAVRDLLRRYVGARLDAYGHHRGDESKVSDLLGASRRLERELWSRAVEASAGTEGYRATMLLNSLNEAFDDAEKRGAVTNFHPPPLVFLLLLALGLASALLAGLGMGDSTLPNRLHCVMFAGVVSLVVYVSLDLELPRQGLIHIDRYDNILRDAREAMQ